MLAIKIWTFVISYEFHLSTCVLSGSDFTNHEVKLFRKALTLCKEALTKRHTYFENASHKISINIVPKLS